MIRYAAILLVVLLACTLAQGAVPARCKHAVDTTGGAAVNLWSAERKLGKAGKEYDMAPDLICRNCADDEELSPDLLYTALCVYAPEDGWTCTPDFKGEGAETAGWDDLELGCMACDAEFEHLIYPASCSLRFDLRTGSQGTKGEAPARFQAYAYTAPRKAVAGGEIRRMAVAIAILLLILGAVVLCHWVMKRPARKGKAIPASPQKQKKKE